jgi:hypothetical protein
MVARTHARIEPVRESAVLHIDPPSHPDEFVVLASAAETLAGSAYSPGTTLLSPGAGRTGAEPLRCLDPVTLWRIRLRRRIQDPPR